MEQLAQSLLALLHLFICRRLQRQRDSLIDVAVGAESAPV